MRNWGEWIFMPDAVKGCGAGTLTSYTPKLELSQPSVTIEPATPVFRAATATSTALANQLVEADPELEARAVCRR